ncbi:hypothetical protein V0288_01315 [Pannus brasiliensis CCIBt3594]|uniref:Uncharacterized protein n=1 Tax=Pannus brasiliensis CCIBt3594 TaxID=1427578 RepID=A0AAW9QKU7_9CHRO
MPGSIAGNRDRKAIDRGITRVGNEVEEATILDRPRERVEGQEIQGSGDREHALSRTVGEPLVREMTVNRSLAIREKGLGSIGKRIK